MRLSLQSALFVSRAAGALGLSFLFFVLISALHGIFGVSYRNAQGKRGESRIVAEAVRLSPPKEQRRAQSRIRKIETPSERTRGAGESRMSMRIMPDLGPEAAAGVEMEARQQGDLAPEVFEEGETDEDFVPLYTPAPPYPDRARELGIAGELEVVFVVDINGSVSSVEIVRSPHPSFVTEARKVIGSWRFKPARNKGVPVRVRARQVFDFKLD